MVKIVIVDDYLETAETLAILYKSKANVEIVGLVQNSEQLWRTAAEREMDLLSLDIQLIGESGLELCEQFHLRYPDVFIVMCSVEATEENKRRAKEAGASHFLAKPISMRDVSEVLELWSTQHKNMTIDTLPLTAVAMDKLFEDL